MKPTIVYKVVNQLPLGSGPTFCSVKVSCTDPAFTTYPLKKVVRAKYGPLLAFQTLRQARSWLTLTSGDVIIFKAHAWGVNKIKHPLMCLYGLMHTYLSVHDYWINPIGIQLESPYETYWPVPKGTVGCGKIKLLERVWPV